MTFAAIAFLGSLGISLLATRLVRDFSRSIGFVDKPDGKRKTHEKPVALGGGVAVMLSTLLAATLTVVSAWLLGYPLTQPRDFTVLLGISISALLIVLLGLYDDRFNLRGRFKLVGQGLIAAILIYSGVRIDSVSVFSSTPPDAEVAVAESTASAAGVAEVAKVAEDISIAETSQPSDGANVEGANVEGANATEAEQLGGITAGLGMLAIPFTLFWLLGAINAFNLIDGIDGLAGSVGVVVAVTMAGIMVIQGNELEIIIMLALAGSLLGFLRFNFAPASIYLGDAGSMFIGLLIGAIAVHSSLKSAATMALTVPAAVWAIPILDSAAAILRRKLTGRSLFAADRGHLHHSLLVRGWTVRQAVLFIGLICSVTCLSAVLSVYFHNEVFALATVAVVIGFLISTRTFGHIEFALVWDHFRKHTDSLTNRNGGSSSGIRETTMQLQGDRPWDKLWSAVTESASQYGLHRVKLHIHIPSMHEDFFANWEAGQMSRDELENAWQVSHPLLVDGQRVGQLTLSGTPQTGSTLGHIINVLDFLEPIEDDVKQIMEALRHEDAIVRTGNASSPKGTKPTPKSPAQVAST